jgi:hypothetical protein
LEIRRAPVAHRGDWQNVAPLTPTATGAAAPIVSASATFLASVAGARPIVEPGSLRDVSAGAPRGIVVGLARATESPSRSPAPPEDHAPAPAPQLPDVAPPRRPSVGASRRPDVDLTSYSGPLEFAEYDEAFEPTIPGGNGDDEIPEELPPPIFTSLLAERTGRDLAELRPDLADGYAAGTEADEAALRDAIDEAREPRRKRSLAESRRLGLGAPLRRTSVPGEEGEADDLAAVESIEVIEAPPAIEPPPSPPVPSEPARRAAARYRAAEPAPDSVRADLRRVLGRDPGPAQVRRDMEASRLSAQIGARAYTRAGEVFVPHEAGPLDGPETRAVLAHELTHLVQQRVYGPTLPAPSTPVGRRLEAEARAVERVVRGDDPEPRVAPVRTLRATADGPRVDSGGFLREITRQLRARSSDEPGSLSALSSDIWRAPTDAAEDPDFQRAVAEDRQAFEHWRVDHNTSSDDAARSRMDSAELERHAQFMEQYGSRLYGGTGGGVGGGTGSGADDYSKSPSVAAHEAFAGVFTEGWRNLDFGIGGFLGQFGRDTDARDKANERIRNYAADYGNRPGEDPKVHEARVQRLQDTLHAARVLPVQPSTTAPSPSAPATGRAPSTSPQQPTLSPSRPAPTSSTSVTSPNPPEVAAHEAFAGVFTEGWRNLDFGIGGFLGQFGRDTDARDKANERIRNYAADYGKKGEDESAEHFEHRAKRLQETLEKSGAIKPESATTAAVPAGGAATPAAQGGSPAGAAATQPGATPAATVAGAAAVGAVAGAGIATAAHALHGERGSRGREREVPGADPTDVLAHLDDHDVEALASMLYGRMVTRFRKQLLIDRERSGFLTDFR